MEHRPGSTLTQRALHFFIVADCSGSMAADGKIQALNNAVRETLPHLVSVSSGNPHAQFLVRAVGFSSGAWWHVGHPTAVDALLWEDLSAGGYSDLGAALSLLSEVLDESNMPQRALPPAILLISDGMPTDDYEGALAHMLSTTWGQRSVRLAVGIGREYDEQVLQQFIGPGAMAPLTATNPEQIVRCIRWASIHASQLASRAVSNRRRYGPVALEEPSGSDLTW